MVGQSMYIFLETSEQHLSSDSHIKEAVANYFNQTRVLS